MYLCVLLLLHHHTINTFQFSVTVREAVQDITYLEEDDQKLTRVEKKPFLLHLVAGI